jgi:hypothetical protein
VRRIHATLGKFYRATGRHEEVEREFPAARTIIGELAATVPDETLRESFVQRAQWFLR